MSQLALRVSLGLCLMLATTLAWAAASGPVTVRYDHPENFTETREVRAYAPMEADPGYLDTLARYIEKRAAKILGPGQQLDITVTDVDRAGSYLPSVGSSHPVRIVESIYPPRIALHFRLLDSQGQVVRGGDRKLTDLGFLYDTPGGGTDTDSLRYEKRLIDRWLAKGPAGL